MIGRMREWWHDPPARGRHRLGLPTVRETDCRWLWDTAERAAAARLDLVERAWTVLYGVGRRRFYAFAQWATDEPLVVEATSVEGLREVMREAEAPALGPATWTRRELQERRAA